MRSRQEIMHAPKDLIILIISHHLSRFSGHYRLKVRTKAGRKQFNGTVWRWFLLHRLYKKKKSPVVSSGCFSTLLSWLYLIVWYSSSSFEHAEVFFSSSVIYITITDWSLVPDKISCRHFYQRLQPVSHETKPLYLKGSSSQRYFFFFQTLIMVYSAKFLVTNSSTLLDNVSLLFRQSFSISCKLYSLRSRHRSSQGSVTL